MKRLGALLPIVLLLLWVPTAVRADTIWGFQFGGGSLGTTTPSATSGVTNAGAGSGITGYCEDGVCTPGVFGSITFTTGSLLSGSLSGGGTFGAGGSVTIQTNAAFTALTGVPEGTFFVGSFSGPVNWLLLGCTGPSPTASCTYTLGGPISGITWAGFEVLPGSNLFSVEFNASQGPFDPGDSALINTGAANLVVPEPATLALFGTGLIGIAGLIRRKR